MIWDHQFILFWWKKFSLSFKLFGKLEDFLIRVMLELQHFYKLTSDKKMSCINWSDCKLKIIYYSIQKQLKHQNLRNPNFWRPSIFFFSLHKPLSVTPHCLNPQLKKLRKQEQRQSGAIWKLQGHSRKIHLELPGMIALVSPLQTCR